MWQPLRQSFATRGYHSDSVVGLGTVVTTKARSHTTATSLGDALDPRHNSIGFLRLVCALAVLLGHSFPYGGFGADPFLVATNNQMSPGRTAVDVFFCISGFLITWSFTKATGPLSFAWHRFLRIYPAYWACIAFTGLVLATFFGGGSDMHYIVGNLTILAGGIDHVDGLFVGGPYDGSVNGPLWTLRWELLAYAMVGVLGIIGLLTRRIFTVFLLAGVWAYFAYLLLSYPGLTTSPAITSWSRLFTFFLAGMVFFNFRDRIPMRVTLFVSSCVLMLLAGTAGNLWLKYSGGLFYITAPIPLTYAVFFLATQLPRTFTRINARTDLSYGLYIYGTLLLGVLVDQRIGTGRWVTLFGLAATLAVIAAGVSWFAIERPALAQKRRTLRPRPASQV